MCGGCGTRQSEWDRDRDAYVGDITICPGCERVDQERENAKGMNAKGLRIGLVPMALAKTGEEVGAG